MPPRPVLRGVSHLVAAIVAPAALVALLLIAASPRAYVGGGHLWRRAHPVVRDERGLSPAAVAHREGHVLKRADHATIFVFIAATYTPFCLNVLGDAWGIPLLVAVWSSAALGVVFKVARPDVSRWLGVGLYLGVGWLAFVAAWPLAHRAPEVLPGLLVRRASVLSRKRRVRAPPTGPLSSRFRIPRNLPPTRDRRRRHQLRSDRGLRASALTTAGIAAITSWLMRSMSAGAVECS